MSDYKFNLKPQWTMTNNKVPTPGTFCQQPAEWETVNIVDLDFSKVEIAHLSASRSIIMYNGKNLSLRVNPGGLWCWNINRDMVYDSSNKKYTDTPTGTFSMRTYSTLKKDGFANIDQDNLHKHSQGDQIAFVLIAFIQSLTEYMERVFSVKDVQTKLSITQQGNVSFKTKPPTNKSKGETPSASDPQTLKLDKIDVNGAPSNMSEEELLALASNPINVCGYMIPYITSVGRMKHIGLTWTYINVDPRPKSNNAQVEDMRAMAIAYARENAMNEHQYDLE